MTLQPELQHEMALGSPMSADKGQEAATFLEVFSGAAFFAVMQLVPSGLAAREVFSGGGRTR